MIRRVITFFAAIAASAVSAQQLPSYIERPSDAAGVFAIWRGSGVPPGSEKWTWHEQQMEMPGSTKPTRMVRNVVIPTVTMFKPAAGAANGTALIVAPGGAFSFLMIDYEGYCGIVRHSTLWLLCRIRHSNHRHSFIFAAVRPCPQRPPRASGRLANGHC
jgi:hypothetical protein